MLKPKSLNAWDKWLIYNLSFSCQGPDLFILFFIFFIATDQLKDLVKTQKKIPSCAMCVIEKFARNELMRLGI
jgi:hypothetical protein